MVIICSLSLLMSSLDALYAISSCQPLDGCISLTDGWSGSRVAEARKHFTPIVMTGDCACNRCGKAIDPDESWQVDHIISRAQGGTHHLSNLWPAHAHCNMSAGGHLGNARKDKRSRAGQRLRQW